MRSIIQEVIIQREEQDRRGKHWTLSQADARGCEGDVGVTSLERERGHVRVGLGEVEEEKEGRQDRQRGQAGTDKTVK